MFIIKCSDDGGYCVLENHEVICDENTVNQGDSVSFLWRSKELTGIVITYSESEEFINAKYKEITKRLKSKLPSKQLATKSDDTEIPEKRRRQAFQKVLENVEALEKSKKSTAKKKTVKAKVDIQKAEKMLNVNTESIMESEKEEDNLKEDDNSTPSESESDEDNRNSEYHSGKKCDIEQLRALSAKDSYSHFAKTVPTPPKLIPNVNSELSQSRIKPSSSSNLTDSQEENDEPVDVDLLKQSSRKTSSSYKLMDSAKASIGHQQSSKDQVPLSRDKAANELDDEDIDNDNFCDNSQLYGKDYPNFKMTHIGMNIYCKRITIQNALGVVENASHLARRMLNGVFKIEAIKECTFTGQSYRPAKNSGQPITTQPKALHRNAKNAIIKFAMNKASEFKWDQVSEKDVKRSMSQRLGEIKREIKSAEEQNKNYEY